VRLEEAHDLLRGRHFFLLEHPPDGLIHHLLGAWEKGFQDISQSSSFFGSAGLQGWQDLLGLLNGRLSGTYDRRSPSLASHCCVLHLPGSHGAHCECGYERLLAQVSSAPSNARPGPCSAEPLILSLASFALRVDVGHTVPSVQLAPLGLANSLRRWLNCSKVSG
jgi:hypothetical protein